MKEAKRNILISKQINEERKWKVRSQSEKNKANRGKTFEINSIKEEKKQNERMLGMEERSSFKRNEEK